MDLEENDEDIMPPIGTNTFGIPNDPKLLAEYELYRPSMGTRQLLSERNRSVYTEAFIEHERLGTLADLCVRALAKLGTMQIAEPVRQDPLKLRIHYDTIDVNLPLKECYFVDDLLYWRRVVLAKSTDKSLALKKLNEYDWKGAGISIKYVEIVEECPAGFWPEEEMAGLAALVSEHVHSLDIRHLQSLTEEAFARYIDSETELDVTSEESEEIEVSSDEPDTNDEESEEFEEEDEQNEQKLLHDKMIKMTSIVSFQPPTDQHNKDDNRDTTSQRQSVEKTVSIAKSSLSSVDTRGDARSVDWEAELNERRRARYARNAARQELRDMQLAKRVEHERRRRQRSLLRKPPVEETPKKKKKNRKAGIKGVFDIKVDSEPEDNEDKIVDKRNKQKLLQSMNNYDYPAEHCHHIDLSFVRYFNNLVSLSLQFLGPHIGRDFHKRHLKFSYDDMTRLAKGLRTLEKLKIFRLRNSSMDVKKLQTLSRALKALDELEVVDFGYDQMTDDCGATLGMILERDNMFKALELEYNRLDTEAAFAIGRALFQHKGTGTLEYLGLAHNIIDNVALHNLSRHIVGTPHVQELKLSGIEASKSAVCREISYILRQHLPLRSLDIVAIPMDPLVSREIVCALEASMNISHFDSRECDMDIDEDLEADIIIRRNHYLSNTEFMTIGVKRSEEELVTAATNWKHPIVRKIENDMAQRAECIRNRPPRAKLHSEPNIISDEAKKSVETELGSIRMKSLVFPSLTKSDGKSFLSDSISSKPQPSPPFEFNPNSFNLNQFREHVFLPGPSNRHYYLQQNRI
ncbi:uncharacterized protein Dwil_GK26831 [Drosophila willistoni]|uniref:Uncharacterized protein n=1 Tax=Drosophila willistoni TaxID=7260 RepID=A0A0Q9WPG6_DROWI|nr:uncharacterized protein LOC26528833 [Drosophila willistoni]KRF97615.1 uncharacterized protein Dwil_GK26831 [Drosophila willistoni]